jgi:hypothetical protein
MRTSPVRVDPDAEASLPQDVSPRLTASDRVRTVLEVSLQVSMAMILGRLCEESEKTG